MLIPRPWRPVAVLAWTTAAFVLAVLAWHFAHSGPTDAADALVGAHVTSRLAAHPHLLSLAAQLGSPGVVIGGSVTLALLWLIAGRRRAALFALVAAPAAGAITELLLKPAVHRQLHPQALMFPSGHATGAFALALTVVVLLLPREQTRLLPALAGIVVGTAALAVASVVAVAVVALGWHYVTDVIGGVVTAVVVVVGAAALIDAVARRDHGVVGAIARDQGVSNACMGGNAMITQQESRTRRRPAQLGRRRAFCAATPQRWRAGGCRGRRRSSSSR